MAHDYSLELSVYGDEELEDALAGCMSAMVFAAAEDESNLAILSSIEKYRVIIGTEIEDRHRWRSRSQKIA